MTSFIGRAWIPNDTSLDTASYRCKCVQDGKVQLVATTLPDDLCQPHRNGEWCPCEGSHKKWIYLNKPSTSDPKCCGLQMCYGTCQPQPPKKKKFVIKPKIELPELYEEESTQWYPGQRVTIADISFSAWSP